jgi:lipopolysaccharide transport system ATP-binding protein
VSSAAIRVLDLSKRFQLGESRRSQSLRESIVQAFRSRVNRDEAPRRRDHIWALRDVCFEVSEGEVVGIIGSNGAGKSTLLRILARITAPTSGCAEIRGRVASLLEVGTGFHPELTGRENVYLNGAILGMRRTEIVEKFNRIVEFSGVEDFLDTPVKRYSSGMRVRLAFSVAAHLEPEVLIIDEVLAVGDVSFQNRCLGKMGEIARGGRTVLFVSHNMAAVSSLCSRGILLREGRVDHDGPTLSAVKRYLSPEVPTPREGHLARSDDEAITLVRLETVTVEQEPLDVLLSGQAVVFRLLVHSKIDVGNATLSISIDDAFGVRVAILTNVFFTKPLAIEADYNLVTCNVPELPLTAGRYHFSIKLTGPDGVLIWAPQIATIQVEKGDFFGSGKMPDGAWVGSTLIKHHWDVEHVDESSADI